MGSIAGWVLFLWGFFLFYCFFCRGTAKFHVDSRRATIDARNYRQHWSSIFFFRTPTPADLENTSFVPTFRSYKFLGLFLRLEPNPNQLQRCVLGKNS